MRFHEYICTQYLCVSFRFKHLLNGAIAWFAIDKKYFKMNGSIIGSKQDRG